MDTENIIIFFFPAQQNISKNILSVDNMLINSPELDEADNY